MRAAMLIQPKKFSIQNILQPIPGEGEILIRVTHTGICGSDIHFYETGRIGEVILQEPFVMGHEFCGIVEDTNSVAGSPPKGTRVAVDPAIPCESCEFCHHHQYNICPNIRFTGFPPFPGALQEFIAMPPVCLFPMPEELPGETGPLLETLAVALHGFDLVPDVAGKTCVVLGAGPVGLLVLALLKLKGADILFVTEPVAERREFARRMGAQWVFDPADKEQIHKHNRQIGSYGPDIIFEAAGEPESYQMAIDLIRPAGLICYFGIYPAGRMGIDFTPARRKEITMVFVRRSLPKNYPDAIALVQQNQVDLTPMVSHVFPLSKIAEAFNITAQKQDGAVKVVLRIE